MASTVTNAPILPQNQIYGSQNQNTVQFLLFKISIQMPLNLSFLFLKLPFPTSSTVCPLAGEVPESWGRSGIVVHFQPCGPTGARFVAHS